MPGGFVCSASFKAKLGADRRAVRPPGKRPLRKLFTKGQRAILRRSRPDGIELDELSILGPMNVMKLKFKPAGFARRLVVELWLYPDGSRILELSTKCQPSETFQVAAEARAFLADRGVDLTRRAADQDGDGACVLLGRTACRLTSLRRQRSAQVNDDTVHLHQQGRIAQPLRLPFLVPLRSCSSCSRAMRARRDTASTHSSRRAWMSASDLATRSSPD